MTQLNRRSRLLSSYATIALASSGQLVTAMTYKDLLHRSTPKASSQSQENDLPSSLFKELPPSLDSLTNNSLFTYWRPKAHFIAPNSWQNDPMNMWVDRAENGTLTWHVGYQYHYAHINWGNISQGAAFSHDFITWTDAVGPHEFNPTTISPTAEYDKLGVFDGTHIPAEDGFDGFPSMIYTSVRDLPTGWNIPYINGTESQSLIWTEDNGATWKRFEGNPVIPHPPSNINVTGWRDPFVFKSTRLDSVLQLNSTNSTADRLYLTISSGDRPTTGPRLLLYTQTTPGNLTSWDYLGPLLAPAGNTSFEPWGGNVGFNFEVANLVWLSEQGDASAGPVEGDELVESFIIAGAQGSRADHGGNWPLWFGGSLIKNDTGAEMNVTFSGVGDWGTAYACLSFLDDKSDFAPRRLMYCWIYEGDNGTSEGLLARGWNGALSTPRELFLKVIRNVTSDTSLVEEEGSWGHRTESDGSTTVFTLGQVRAREVKAAMRSRSVKHPNERVPAAEAIAAANSNVSGLFVPFTHQPTTRNYEIYAPVNFSTNATTGKAGIYLLATGNPSETNDTSLLEYTTITYDLETELLIVNRSHSSLVKNLTQVNDEGKLRLWHVNGAREPLHLVVNVDNSFVEVYANDQLAISSRIYPWLNASVNAGWYLPDGASDDITFGETQVWEGFFNAWPERPENTSVPLVWDGPNVPWAGN